MDYDAFSHLINLLGLVGYLVSGAWGLNTLCVTLKKVQISRLVSQLP